MGTVFDEITGVIDTKSNRPIWMMRQAGRYLPEYRAVRAKFPSFMDFCFHPDAATEVTLQPITRFGFDAAIIFSDILVIPQALGQEVWFVKGEGPKLGSLPDIELMESRLSSGAVLEHLTKVYEAIALTRRELPAETDLFGFAGAPWTLLTYMIEQGSSNDYAKALALAAAEPELFQRLLAVVEQAVVQHLKAQVNAGANLLQLFDSWAGGIPEDHQQTGWSFDPLVRIAATVSQDAPVVLFAKGLAQEFASAKRDELNALSGKIAVAVGQDQNVLAVRNLLSADLATQGNLNPQLMPGPWAELKKATTELLEKLAPMDRHVVNLGHGITPEGDAENVHRWVDFVKEYDR